MPADTTAIKQMLDDDLSSDGTRQIKASGLRATLKALVDWVGSVAGVPGPVGPTGANWKVVRITTAPSSQLLVENNTTYIIEGSFTVQLKFTTASVAAGPGLRFEIIKNAAATVMYTYLVSSEFPGNVQKPDGTANLTLGNNKIFTGHMGNTAFGFPTGVTSCAWIDSRLYVW
jgi:hypothetical protein